MKTMTLPQVEAKIARVIDTMVMYEEMGNEAAAQTVCDYLWDLRIVRDNMKRARAINLRARLVR